MLYKFEYLENSKKIFDGWLRLTWNCPLNWSSTLRSLLEETILYINIIYIITRCDSKTIKDETWKDTISGIYNNYMYVYYVLMKSNNPT